MIFPARTDLPAARKLRTGGMTLLEVALAVTIALLIAGVTIPATGGWIEEHKLRSGLNTLAEQVMRARLSAERTGEQRRILLGGEAEPDSDEIGEQSSEYHFPIPPGMELGILSREGKWEDASGRVLRIWEGGVVSVERMRIQSGDKWIIFQFDPLTGHLQEEEFSL